MKRSMLFGVLCTMAAAAAGHLMRMHAASADAGSARARIEESSATTRGPARAKVRVVLFGSVGSPATQSAEGALRRLQQSAEGIGVQWIWKDLPSGSEAELAARAARAAGVQGKFWALHDRLSAARQPVGPALLDWAVAQAGLDSAQFQRDLSSTETERAMESDQREAARLNVQSEGALFVNGRRLASPFSVDALRELIKEERALADRLLSSGVSWSRLQDEISTH